MGIEQTGRLVSTICLVVLLGACGTPGQRTEDSGSVAAGGQGLLDQWALESGQPLVLDTRQSRVVLRVYRAGRLARLGHNHVLEVTDLRGSLKQLEGGGGLAELTFGVDGIRVDDSEARARAGAEFAQQPDEDAIAGTRRNMLGEQVLDAANWPLVHIHARIGQLDAATPTAEVLVSVRGVSQRYETPVEVETRDSGARVSGVLTVRQSDFGIRPFSVLGGALRVRDEIQAEFLVVGHKSGGAMW